MSEYVEDRHEVKLKRRLADVRPWTDKAREMLADRFMFAVATLPLLGGCALWPLASFVLLPLVAVLISTHQRMRVVLPMRYPAMNPESDPGTGQPGTGILFFGNQESSSPFEKFKEIWASDDDLRKHMVILGATGSGKSELLKSLFFNALCWSSGFFIADGKADNRLPTDVFTMVRSVGMDDNLLTLNFLLAGKTPEQVRRSRRRRTHKLNPFTSADSDTIIQMGANMLPKVEGDGKNWQEKALNLWRAMVVALCYKRDTQGFDLSVSTLVEYMNLAKIEELYIEGYDEAERDGEWSYGFIGIKTYLDSGCPAYKVDKLLAKFNRGQVAQQPQQPPAFGAARPTKANSTEQDSMAYEQHAYRTSQLMPVLNLLDKTYGHIFRDKFPEIDMVDVTLNNRIMTMLIPSLEKSAQEAENLGKLAIACLRVMMSRNLGGGVEGSRMELLESKATNSPYPYLVALDELGYYFSDGIAVIFAQARSLGFCMIPAAQDLEKLTEGSRAAEAGAMLANTVTKIFLRIDDPKKTYEFVQGVVGKAIAAVYRNFERSDMGWRRKTEVDLQEIDRVSMKQLQALQAGQGLINSLGRTTRFRSYYMDSDLKKHKAEDFYLLRFLQVAIPSDQTVDAYSMPYEIDSDPLVRGERLRAFLAQDLQAPSVAAHPSPVIEAVRQAAQQVSPHVAAEVRAIALFQAARAALAAARARVPQEVGKEAGSAGASVPAPAPAVGHDGVESGLDGRIGPEQSQMQTTPWTDVRPSTWPGIGPFGMGRGRPVVAAGDPASAGDAAGGLDWRLEGGRGVAPSLPRRGGDPMDERNPASVTQSDLADLADLAEQEDPARGLDLEELLSPNLPFQRRALEELRAADGLSELTQPGLANLAATAVESDPVEGFFAGLKFFSMALPATEDTFGAEPSRAQDTADDGKTLGADPHAGQTPLVVPGLTQVLGVDDGPGRVDLAAERTAVGFADGTLQQLQQIEQMLGHPQPAKAVRDLQTMISERITPRLRPEMQADDLIIDQVLQGLDLIDGGGPAGP